MYHPLPEVPKVIESKAKLAFFGLKFVGITGLAFLIASFLFEAILIKTDIQSTNREIQNFVAGAACFYLVALVFLLRGYNWARWLVIVLSIITVALYLFLPVISDSKFPEIKKTYDISATVWWAGVAFWLLLPSVARHFKEPKSV